jgi:hypothetical protein
MWLWDGAVDSIRDISAFGAERIVMLYATSAPPALL